VSTLREVYTCPHCGGSGVIDTAAHEHQWRFASSMTGDGWGQVVWACTFDGCEATVCSDCVKDGFETCADRSSASAAGAAP
jgi:hypothetical protein